MRRIDWISVALVAALAAGTVMMVAASRAHAAEAIIRVDPAKVERDRLDMLTFEQTLYCVDVQTRQALRLGFRTRSAVVAWVQPLCAPVARRTFPDVARARAVVADMTNDVIDNLP